MLSRAARCPVRRRIGRHRTRAGPSGATAGSHALCPRCCQLYKSGL